MKHTLLLLSLFAVQAVAQDKALLDLALEPPVVNTQPGPEYDADKRPGNMIIGIDRTPKGRLWAAWVGNGDSPNGFFMLATSEDDGKSWSKPRVRPPHTPSQLHAQGQLDPAPSKAISYQKSGRATKLENEHRRKFFKEQAAANAGPDGKGYPEMSP